MTTNSRTIRMCLLTNSTFRTLHRVPSRRRSKERSALHRTTSSLETTWTERTWDWREHSVWTACVDGFQCELHRGWLRSLSPWSLHNNNYYNYYYNNYYNNYKDNNNDAGVGRGPVTVQRTDNDKSLTSPKLPCDMSRGSSGIRCNEMWTISRWVWYTRFICISVKSCSLTTC